MLTRIAFAFAFIFVQLICIAQSDVDSINFQPVDSFVTTVKYKGDIQKLANDLTKPYTDYVLQFRSIFKWVTNNIRYDYEFVNNERELKKPDCDQYVDCAPVMNKWERNYLKKILRSKKSIDEGYARLFKALCELSGLSSEVIFGYMKTKPYQVGNNISATHYWNAVLIYGEWFYLDASCAAGDCTEDDETGMLTGFTPNFKKYYWLVPFDKMVRNHYPKDQRWVEQPAFTKAKFFNMPFYYTTGILANINNELPTTGMLTVKKGDTIHFKFNYKNTINKLQINSNVYRNPSLWYTEKVKRRTKKVYDTWAEKKQVFIPFIKTGDTYEFNYTVTDQSLYYLELVFDYEKAMRYRIRVE